MEHIRIDEKLIIHIPESLKTIPQYNHNVQTYTIDCPRYTQNGEDMLEMVPFISVEKKGEKEPIAALCSSPILDDTDKSIIHFNWTIRREVTDTVGKIGIVVCVRRSEEENLENAWHTFRNEEIEIKKGIDCGLDMMMQYPGLIEELLYRLGIVEKSGGAVPDKTLTISGAPADSKVTGDKFRQLSATVNDLEGNMENVGQPTDEQVKNSVEEYLNENPPSFTSKIKAILPKNYKSVNGDTLEIFYRGIINAVYPDILYPVITNSGIGIAYKNRFSWNPWNNNGNHNLNIKLYDNDKNLIDSASTKIIQRGKATNPSSEKVVLYVSDSLANGGYVPDEFYQRIRKDGLTNVKFIGTQKSLDNAVPYEGYGGWTFGSYNSTDASSTEKWITCEGHGKTDDDQHSVYTDSYGNTWALETIESNRIKITLESGSFTIPSSGTLTWVSGGSNHDAITYTSAVTGASNPFCFDGEVNFSKYAESQGVSAIDYVYVLLGWNTTGYNEAQTRNAVLTFCENVWKSYPDCRIVLLGLQLPAREGLSINYGSSDMGNYQSMMDYVFNLNTWYENIATEYGDILVSYINVSGQFDSENNMPTSTMSPNVRSEKKIEYQSNGVHPAVSGCYQIADACYRDFHHKLQEEFVTVTHELTNCISNIGSTTKVIKGYPLDVEITGKKGFNLSDEDITITMNGTVQTVTGGKWSTNSVTGNISIKASTDEFVAYETNYVELEGNGTYYLTPKSWTVDNPPTYVNVDSKGWEIIDYNYANRSIEVTISDTGITVHKDEVNQYISEFNKTFDGAKSIVLTQGWSHEGTTTYLVDVKPYTDEGGEDTPTEATLSSISATYNGGDVVVGTSVNDLTGITVTGHYSDGTTKNITGYTLSGTIAEGSNTITISYSGKTTTITVIGYVEEPDEPVEVGTIYVEEGRYAYEGSTIETQVDTSMDGFTTTAIPVKVGDVINCTFGSTTQNTTAGGEINSYTKTNNRIAEYDTNGSYVKYAYAPEYPWTSDINGYVRIMYIADYSCSLVGITLNGTDLEVVNNTTTSKPFVPEEEGELTFPFESKSVVLYGNGTYYLTPIEETAKSAPFTYRTNESDSFVRASEIGLDSGGNCYRKIKITISDEGVNIHIPDYTALGGSVYNNQNADITGASWIEWRAEWSPNQSGVLTYRVDTDESQWGVGIPVETA